MRYHERVKPFWYRTFEKINALPRRIVKIEAHVHFLAPNGRWSTVDDVLGRHGNLDVSALLQFYFVTVFVGK